MSQAISACPKCGGEMVQGFVFDRLNAAAHLISQWAEGIPQRSFWTGVKVPSVTIPIGTFRCQSCGFLESYARREFAAK